MSSCFYIKMRITTQPGPDLIFLCYNVWIFPMGESVIELRFLENYRDCWSLHVGKKTYVLLCSNYVKVSIGVNRSSLCMVPMVYI